jgi:Acetyltransferase (GNAT) domain
MGSTEVPPFQSLVARHIADCVALSAEAGWNQTGDDWSLFLEHGTVFGLSDNTSSTIATGAVLPYAGGFAWISMVLVTASRRRERIGTRILANGSAEIVKAGLVPVLDATPAGEQVYRPLGFEPIFGLMRWQGDAGDDKAPAGGIRAMNATDLGAVAALDAVAFGALRRFLIESLYRRAPQLAFVMQDGTGFVRGFVLARPGRIATQIGPIVAADEKAATALLDAALGAASGPVFLDLVDGREEIKRNLQARGYTVQRPFLRMALHRSAPFGDPPRLFVATGPEFG